MFPHELSSRQVTPVPPAGTAQPAHFGRRLAVVLAERGLSESDLANRTGLGAAILGRIFDGTWHPTIDVLWKIANAIGIRLSKLLSSDVAADFVAVPAIAAPTFVSPDGAFVSRLLSPFHCGYPFEAYQAQLAAGRSHEFAAHPPRTYENLTVHAGTLALTVGFDPPRLLSTGDSAHYLADVPHTFRNPGAEPAVLYLVLSYKGLQAT